MIFFHFLRPLLRYDRTCSLYSRTANITRKTACSTYSAYRFILSFVSSLSTVSPLCARFLGRMLLFILFTRPLVGISRAKREHSFFNSFIIVPRARSTFALLFLRVIVAFSRITTLKSLRSNRNARIARSFPLSRSNLVVGPLGLL